MVSICTVCGRNVILKPHIQHLAFVAHGPSGQNNIIIIIFTVIIIIIVIIIIVGVVVVVIKQCKVAIIAGKYF